MGEGLRRGFALAEEDQGKENRDDGEHAQDDAQGQLEVEAAAELLPAVLYQPVHAVGAFDLLPFQVLKAAALQAGGDEQRHGPAHQQEEGHQADPHRLRLGQRQPSGLLRPAQQTQKHRGEDAQQHPQGDPAGRQSPVLQEVGGLLHGYLPDGELRVRHRKGLGGEGLGAQLVLQ